ncbi:MULTISPECIES: hypothetical protein [Shewanella]|uniref:Uncharacterized protein n=1 Tax=Shewanella maritima TaxID=2520507 RepID=A0A411PJ92_9GAMM|nr:hypothetical protein [Shewanella maritima]QBF83647.1 hypothetical protein EXU30_13785 [Shewanella maritima]
MKVFKILHVIGIVMLLVGAGLLLLSDVSLQTQGMLITASLIGGGLLLMSPFPVALFIEWAQAQDKQAQDKQKQD